LDKRLGGPQNRPGRRGEENVFDFTETRTDYDTRVPTDKRFSSKNISRFRTGKLRGEKLKCVWKKTVINLQFKVNLTENVIIFTDAH
jgi:hypothetical protein